jgi:hypothetical protein
MGIFFSTSPLTHLAPKEIFGIAFWIGFSVNTAVVELWLHSRGGRPQIERMAIRPVGWFPEALWFAQAYQENALQVENSRLCTFKSPVLRALRVLMQRENVVLTATRLCHPLVS